MLRLRESLGGVVSGDWLLGATRGPQGVAEHIGRYNVHGDPLAFVAAGLSADLDLTLVINEGNEIILFIRTAHVSANSLETLLQDLARLGQGL